MTITSVQAVELLRRAGYEATDLINVVNEVINEDQTGDPLDWLEKLHTQGYQVVKIPSAAGRSQAASPRKEFPAAFEESSDRIKSLCDICGEPFPRENFACSLHGCPNNK